MSKHETKNGVWILTSANNDYDQHGEYFRGVFAQKPTLGELAKFFGYSDPKTKILSFMEADVFLEHLLAGGGRRGTEYEWYNLTFVQFGTQP